MQRAVSFFANPADAGVFQGNSRNLGVRKIRRCPEAEKKFPWRLSADLDWSRTTGPRSGRTLAIVAAVTINEGLQSLGAPRPADQSSLFSNSQRPDPIRQ